MCTYVVTLKKVPKVDILFVQAATDSIDQADIDPELCSFEGVMCINQRVIT